MIITKIDADTVIETTESESMVKISELEAELVRMKASNVLATEIEELQLNTPEHLRQYIMRLPKFDVDSLEQKIKDYKKL